MTREEMHAAIEGMTLKEARARLNGWRVSWKCTPPEDAAPESGLAFVVEWYPEIAAWDGDPGPYEVWGTVDLRVLETPAGKEVEPFYGELTPENRKAIPPWVANHFDRIQERVSVWMEGGSPFPTNPSPAVAQ